MKRDTWLYVTAVTGGALVWALMSASSHKREAWDSDLYFTVGLPAVCLLSAVLGYLQPDKPWRWGAAPLAGQGSWLLITQGPGNLLPLGIVLFGILALPSIFTAKLGARMAKKRAPET